MQFQLSEPSPMPLVPPMVPGPQRFRCFQLLLANLNVQGANEFLNSLYNMVQQQNLQSLAERLLCIEESIHHVNQKSNTVQDVVS